MNNKWTAIKPEDTPDIPWECRIYHTGNRNHSTMITRSRPSSVRGQREYEVWEMYSPVRAGAQGRQRSVLRARFTAVASRNRYGRLRHGLVGYMESFYFNGVRHRQRWHSNKPPRDIDTSVAIKEACYDSNGRLLTYMDRTRGEFNTREVTISHQHGKRQIIVWRNKYSRKEKISEWRSEPDDCRVSRNEQGLPLLMDGDFTRRTFRQDGTLKDVCKFVGGREHGEEKIFNRQGRQIDSKYYHHGTEIPRWVFEKPETIELVEVLEEQNLEVRRAMMELQGFEVFLARAEKAGMVRVIDQDPDDKVGTLIEINTMPDSPTFGLNKDQLDARIFMLLKVKDGTLPKSYVLRVPRGMKTARQANAWTWGLEAEEYKPSIER